MYKVICLVLTFFLICLITSCDPAYGLIIKNDTDRDIKIKYRSTVSLSEDIIDIEKNTEHTILFFGSFKPRETDSVIKDIYRIGGIELMYQDKTIVIIKDEIIQKLKNILKYENSYWIINISEVEYILMKN